MESAITYFEKRGEVIINHGTFVRPGGQDHTERLDYARKMGVPETWTHCRLSPSENIEKFGSVGHYKDTDGDSDNYWLAVEEDGRIIGQYIYDKHGKCIGISPCGAEWCID